MYIRFSTFYLYSLRTNSRCSCKFLDFSPNNSHAPTRRDVTLSVISTDSALEFHSNFETNRVPECVMKHMLECFQPTPDSLLRFRLCMLKDLVQRQASKKNIAKEFFVILHTIKSNFSNSICKDRWQALFLEGRYLT